MGSWGYATCPTDGAPLVMTFEMPKKEFICMECGRYWEFLEPVPRPETPGLLARYEELRARFNAGERPTAPFVHDGSGPDVDPATGDEAETFQP